MFLSRRVNDTTDDLGDLTFSAEKRENLAKGEIQVM
jgi:hypothetical protein